MKLSKWPVVDFIADVLLKVLKEHRLALRAKVESISSLKGKKEALVYLEKLSRVERKDPEVAKRYGLAILEENKERGLELLKRSGEIYARLRDYKNLEDIWITIIRHDYADMAFFERVERIVVRDRQHIWIAVHYSYLVEPYRLREDWSNVIYILKKIAQYDLRSSRTRSELVRAYRTKYTDHSLLDEFLKISGLTNHQKPIEPCIANFERNIVFDTGNYVYHRSRGVGKIAQIDSEKVIIDFARQPEKTLSIQMAIHSLQPLKSTHIWARHYENPIEIEELFQSDSSLFLELLLSSFDNKMTVTEIKSQIVGRMLGSEAWSKWWSKLRAQVKNDPRFGFSTRRKDLLLLRDVPMSLNEELSLNFQDELDWDKKLDIAFSTLKNIDVEGAALLAVQFYKSNEKNKDLLRALHSYMFLSHASKAFNEEIHGCLLTRADIQAMIQHASVDDLQKWSEQTQVLEFKKELVNLVVEYRPEDYLKVLKSFLFETPIKLHRYIFSELLRLNNVQVISEFFDELFKSYREYPEIFLWAVNLILHKHKEDYMPYITISHEEVFLLTFRLLKPLANVKDKATRLQKSAIEVICGSSNSITVESLHKYDILVDILKTAKPELIQRMLALFFDVSYIPDAHKENLLLFIQELRPDVQLSLLVKEAKAIQGEAIDSLYPSGDIILSSSTALERRRQHMDKLIHVDMPANSKDISEAQEKGDLRENSEYKAAMEKQSQIQAEILRVSQELQKARTIRVADILSDRVSIGACVSLTVDMGQDIEYSILGPWDADPDKYIISYGSPLARALIGKKLGDKVNFGEEDRHVYTIKAIRSALG